MNRRNLRPHKILAVALVAAPACMTNPSRTNHARMDAFRAAAAVTSVAEASQTAVLPVTDSDGFPLVGNVVGKVPASMARR